MIELLLGFRQMSGNIYFFRASFLFKKRRRTRQLRLTFAKKFGFLIHLNFKIICSRHRQKRRLLMKPDETSKAKITAVESSLTPHFLLFLFTHLFTLTRLNHHLDGT